MNQSVNPHRADLQRSYDRHAQEREEAPSPRWKDAERDAFAQVLRAAGTQTLLEIGAGTGRDGLHFQQQGLRVVCLDLSPVMAGLCRQKGLPVCVMDTASLGIAPGAVDAAFACNSLLHLPKPSFLPVLRQISQCLQPGGWFFLGTHGGIETAKVWQDDHYRPQRFFSFYTDEQLLQVVSQVFTVVSFRAVDTGESSQGLHFQSLVLQKQ